MHEDFERCYRAIASRDGRFDGWWVTGVRSTGVYCRPSCPARLPLRRNVAFYPSSAAAQRAGLRACKRCRPDASPGSPEWSVRADAAGRAMRLIADGVVDREGVPGLAHRLAFSERHLHRLLVAEVGAGPLALARAQRAQTARILIETTDLPFGDVSSAAGFGSARQFNDTVRAVFGVAPTALRARSRHAGTSSPGQVTLRLAVRRPFAATALASYLADRAILGVEAGEARVFRRTLRLPHAGATVELDLRDDHVVARLRLEDMRDLQPAVQRCRRLLDLDADPEAIDAALGRAPVLAPLVAATPGLRSPGAVDGGEIAIRAVVGQQVSVKAARTVLGRLAAEHGEAVDGGGVAAESPAEAVTDRRVAGDAGTPAAGSGALTRRFPTMAALAEADPSALPMPRARGLTVVRVAGAIASGDVVLEPGADRAEATAELLALRGVGPWTAAYVAMRALGDPDILMDGDLGVRRALAATRTPTSALGQAWRPWRSYATHHLWRSEAS